MSKKLTTEQQIYIVQAIATFMSPLEVIEAVKEEFSVTITRQHVREYNPEQNKEIAEKWKVIFDETRKRFVEEVDKIGITHQAYRFRELQKLYWNAGGNKVLKAQLLEQAAKERGGVYTTKREIILDAQANLAKLLGIGPDQLPTPDK